MNIVVEKIVGRKVVVGDIHNDKLIFVIINNFQYKKKYDTLYTSDLDKIDDLIDFIQMSDYFIFFKKMPKFCDRLTDELLKLEKIIFIDEICKKILKPPFDYTIEEIICNLEKTYNYIFGDDNNLKYCDEDATIVEILKICKYLKLNILCDFKLFDSILEKKTNMLRVISFNIFFSNSDLKKNETYRQIAHLKYIDADILFLQECSEEIEKKLLDYEFINTPSHCGSTYLLIKKSLDCEIIDCICQDGIILLWITTIYGQFVLGSLHMIPYDDEDDIMFRIEEIEMFQDWIDANNLKCVPIIIGGDTNMTHVESSAILKMNFFKELSSSSYPNRKIIYKKARNYALNIKEDFNYDKFFIKNVNVKKFQTINTYDSDHLMNYLSIYL